MNYIEIFVTLGFLTGILWGMLKFMLRDIKRDLDDLKSEMVGIKNDFNRTEARIDHLYEDNNRLYKILVEMVRKNNE